MVSKGLLFLVILTVSDLSVLAEDNIIDLQELLISVSTTLRDVQTTRSMVFTKLKEFELSQTTALSKVIENEATLSAVLTKLKENEASLSTVLTKLKKVETTQSTVLTNLMEVKTTHSTVLTKLQEGEATQSMVLTKLKENEATQSTVLTKLKKVEETQLAVSTTLREVKETQSMFSTALNNFTDTIEGTCSKPPEKTPPKDCAELWKSGVRTNGVYRIFPVTRKPTESFNVYCDMVTDGGGWTVFQKRGHYGNPADYFDRVWKDYREGFGDLQKEFWLGNEQIFALTNRNQDSYQIRVDLFHMNGETTHVKYSSFQIEGENQNYRLRINGYTGDAGDIMSYNNEKMFTTKDRDNDENTAGNCAIMFRGAWWHRWCTHANLNGLNQRGNNSAIGMFWYDLKNHHQSLSGTEMKIRPATF